KDECVAGICSTCGLVCALGSSHHLVQSPYVIFTPTDAGQAIAYVNGALLTKPLTTVLANPYGFRPCVVITSHFRLTSFEPSASSVLVELIPTSASSRR